VLVSWVSVVAAGLALGFKHALEADHIAAVALLASERRSLWGAASVGALWGFGHTLAILLAGVWVLALGLRLPESAVPFLEFLVALVLVSLGVQGLRGLWNAKTVHLHAHHHGPRRHVHPHVHSHEHEESRWFHHGQPRYRSFLVGLLHGLAGSAALFLLLLASQPTPALAWAYLAAFAASSVGAMALMSWLVCLPLHLTARRFLTLYRGLQGAAALFSVAVGVHLAWEILGS